MFYKNMIYILLIGAITCFIYGFSPDTNNLATFNVNFNREEASEYGWYSDASNNELLKREKDIIDILSWAKTYNEGGYVYFIGTKISVHRWIMQKYILERELRRGEVVHHINGIKSDNRITNLYLFPNQTKHHLHHKKNSELKGVWHDRLPEYANYKKFIEYA